MLEHHWGYLFGILHHRCFIELCPNHQGSAVSYGGPQETETSKNMAVCLAVLKDQTGAFACFSPSNHAYFTGAHSVCNI